MCSASTPTSFLIRRISSLVEVISKKSIPLYVKYVTLEVMAEDENEEDVEVCIHYTIVSGKSYAESHLRCPGSICYDADTIII